VNLPYRLDGSRDGPALALPSSLGTTMELWAPNLASWSERFSMLRYDQRGHGRCQTPDGPFSVEDLGRDFLQLVDELGIERVSFCGLSFGGATGMWLAAHAPERMERLVLACTSARFGEPEDWLERAARVREGGVEAVADSVLARWFTPRFAAEQLEVVARFRQLLLETPREGYAASCEAIAGWDFRDRLAAIRAPTLVVGAADDPATPPEHARLLADGIPGAKLVVLRDAAHLANVEQAEAFSALVTDHLASPVAEVV
jgi:3-oxoadipate enol-lactonase